MYCKGLTVIEGDAEKDLINFQRSFDYAILSQTLQAFYNPEIVLIIIKSWKKSNCYNTKFWLLENKTSLID